MVISIEWRNLLRELLGLLLFLENSFDQLNTLRSVNDSVIFYVSDVLGGTKKKCRGLFQGATLIIYLELPQ
jgi:hypothetical protein